MTKNKGSHVLKSAISSHFSSGSDKKYKPTHYPCISHSNSNNAPNARDLCKTKLQKEKIIKHLILEFFQENLLLTGEVTSISMLSIIKEEKKMQT